MPFYQILALAIIQGITEFLPISSSGHLIILPYLTGWCDQGLAMDVAVHVGTLIAVILYFWRDVGKLALGGLKLMIGQVDHSGRILLKIIAATPPVLIAGLMLDRYGGDLFRSIEVVGWSLIGFGILLYIADRLGLTVRRFEHVSLPHALIVGVAQMLALIPGTSRSGITITAARILGYERAEAARFSFLLSIPAITAAGLYKGIQLVSEGNPQLLDQALVGAAMAAIAGLLAIAVLMQWVSRFSYRPFVLYRILLGIFLLFMASVINDYPQEEMLPQQCSAVQINQDIGADSGN